MRVSSMARTLRASALPCHTPKRGRTRTVSLPSRVYFRRPEGLPPVGHKVLGQTMGAELGDVG